LVASRLFGTMTMGKWIATLLMTEDEATQQLQGCAGRYVGKTVVITGGAQGIGEGIVRVFFEAGSNVVICDRNEDTGKKLEAELNARAVVRDESGAAVSKQTRKAANRALFVKTDVTVPAQLESLVSQTIKQFGRLDCIVNNAGWHPPHKSIDDFSIEDMESLMRLNFTSVFALCKYSLPHLREVEGNIINVSSLVGHFGQEKATTYAATKGAATSFTKALAIDEAANKVRVNSVSPGNVWTPLWKAGADATGDPEKAKEGGELQQVLGRMGNVLEVGRLCLCIASDMTFTTGVDHIVSGGAEIGYGRK